MGTGESATGRSEPRGRRVSTTHQPGQRRSRPAGAGRETRSPDNDIQRGIDRLIDCYAGGYIEKAEFEPRIAGLFTVRRSYAGAGLKPAPTCSRYTHLRRGDACVALW